MNPMHDTTRASWPNRNPSGLNPAGCGNQGRDATRDELDDTLQRSYQRDYQEARGVHESDYAALDHTAEHPPKPVPWWLGPVVVGCCLLVAGLGCWALYALAH